MSRPPASLNQALWQDLERRLGTRDLLEWLEVTCERLATLGQTHTGAVDFSGALLRDRNIQSITRKPYLPALQTIVPTHAGYAINYGPFQHVQDQRFGIAHEIVHTFWFAPGSAGKPLSPLQRATGDDPTIEWLCNRGAAAILLPRSEVLGLANQVPMVLHQIASTAHRYLVPERLAARRLFHDLARSHLSLLAVRHGSTAAPTHANRVSWFAPSPTAPENRKTIDRRLVPHEIMPDVPPARTCQVGVDGRWLVLIRSASRPERAKPLGNHPRLPPVPAWAANCGDVCYLALASQA
jgi:hypothetical protein